MDLACDIAMAVYGQIVLCSTLRGRALHGGPFLGVLLLAGYVCDACAWLPDVFGLGHAVYNPLNVTTFLSVQYLETIASTQDLDLRCAEMKQFVRCVTLSLGSSN
jgi:hypothetical protein